MQRGGEDCPSLPGPSPQLCRHTRIAFEASQRRIRSPHPSVVVSPLRVCSQVMNVPTSFVRSPSCFLDRRPYLLVRISSFHLAGIHRLPRRRSPAASELRCTGRSPHLQTDSTDLHELSHVTSEPSRCLHLLLRPQLCLQPQTKADRVLQTSLHADDASHASGTTTSGFQASPQLRRPLGVPTRGHLPRRARLPLFIFFFLFFRMF